MIGFKLFDTFAMTSRNVETLAKFSNIPLHFCYTILTLIGFSLKNLTDLVKNFSFI